MIDPIAQLQEDSIGDSVEVKPQAASHGRRPCIAEADKFTGAVEAFREGFQMCIRLFGKQTCQAIVCLHIITYL